MADEMTMKMSLDGTDQELLASPDIENEDDEIEEMDDDDVDIHQILQSADNVAELLEDEDLREIAVQALEDFDVDYASCEGWLLRMNESIKLAMQVTEEKSWPWPGASNVKFPLMTVAAQQFAARVLPVLVKNPYPVSGRVNGYQTLEKMDSAGRMAKHMSWQLTDQMDGWVEDQDRLCHIIPIVGVAYKKTYRDFSVGKNVSELVFPDRLIFDYFCKGVADARCVTHIIDMHPQKIKEMQLLGLYRDVDLTSAPMVVEEKYDTRDAVNETEAPTTGRNQPREILEQHTWLDLDEDGYEEPYCVTIDKQSRQVLRITPRFTEDDVMMSGDGDKVMKIHPVNYFSEYIFLPDPSGGNRGIGWGTILMPINETINTLTNQLVDAGTMNNLGGGLISKELKMQSGNVKSRPGQYTKVNAFGADISKSIFPWPRQEPSQVLYQLLTLFIEWGQRLTSVTDSMSGETPPSNVPATTTMAMLEQGLKVFQGIYQRLYRAMTLELRKLKDLNRRYMDPTEYYAVLDGGPINEQEIQMRVQQGMQPALNPPPDAGVVFREDYLRDDTDVTLTAEPQMSSEQAASARLQTLTMAMQNGLPNVNPQVIEQLLMQSLALPESYRGKVIMPPSQPQPDPTKVMELQVKDKWESQRLQNDANRVAVEKQRADAEVARVQLEHSVRSEGQKLKTLMDSRKHDIAELGLMHDKELREKEIEQPMGGVE